jgi:hypothetical protein
VTDPQPNEIHFDKPTKPNPSQVPSNHVRVVPLMTASMAVITVLDSAEVVHVTHES